MGNRSTFGIKTRWFNELICTDMIKLLRRTKSKTTKDEKGKKVPRLEITEAVLVHCNIFNNSSQHNSRVLHIFVPNKSFGQLLHITHKTGHGLLIKTTRYKG